MSGKWIALAVLLAGCASTPSPHPSAAGAPAKTAEGAAHHHGPSHAAPGQPAKTLSPDPLDAPAPTSVADAKRSEEMAGHGGHGGHEGHEGHGGHGSATYRHVDAGRGTEAPEMETHSGHEGHEGHSQEETTVYTCPMHPEVLSDVPGQCPKCGMTLVERRKE
ncbi:MAG TPA: heavy metal-binding domain-containing protein [Thermoanaerobaculia bacterium]|nr:heavy metal-binding domain-containing protein [Thermoanaerobaculia bacterium]